MDIHLKQWRDQQQLHHESDSATDSSSAALSLFSPEEPTTNKLSNLSAFPPDSSTSSSGTTRFPTKMGSGGYFSLGQWEELELQALIYRHMLTGSAIPPQLLHLLLNKSFLNSPPPYYPYPNFQPPLVQSGYWGRGAMDTEPGRCRRTDGKKWRCSREVVGGHKYCERHINRGRNRSRKPVEIPTTSTTMPIKSATLASGGGGGVLKTTYSTASSIGGGGAQPFTEMACGGTHFALSRPSQSFDLLHLNQRSRNEMPDDEKSDGRILRPFFDDWPRPVDNTGSNSSSVTPATSLSISVPGNGHPSSDFSLRLSTGNGDVPGPQEGNGERERPRLNRGMLWGTNPVASMGGPLAEALRSSTSSNSSPTSVLHQQLRRGSTSEASYIST